MMHDELLSFFLSSFLKGLKEAIRLRTLRPEQLSFVKYKQRRGRVGG